MRIYKLEFQTHLDVSIEKVWDYFSTPANLNDLTPPDLTFEILDEVNGVKMYPGMIIRYRIRPFLNLPLRWTTEITHAKEHAWFVDEQRFGPYAFWHHRHSFETVQTGVLMTDTVHYALPLGFIGRMVNALYVRQKLMHIFRYRQKRIRELFGQS